MRLAADSMLMKRAAAIALATVVLLALWRFPFARPALWIGFGVYAVILHFYPHAWLVAIPALLPVFDLAPWSGWFFLDEFDLLILLTAAFGLGKSDGQELPDQLPRALLFSLFALLLSYLISLFVGLLPLAPLDTNAFSSYYSPYNSLRMAKGLFAAIVLLVMARRVPATKLTAALVNGMVLGLTATTLAVIWERYRFPGLFDFTSDFRSTATFSGLHNGGNDLEAYIALAQPFVIAWVLLRKSVPAGIAGFVLLVFSTYALAATVSRAGLIAAALNWTLLAIGLPISLRRRLRPRLGTIVVLGAGALTVAAVLFFIVRGGAFFQARLQAAKADWDYRVLQAQKTFGIMNRDWRTSLFGMGLGRFPVETYTHNPLGVRPAAYRFESATSNTFLRLSPGSPLYFGQWLTVERFKNYRIALRMRGTGQGALIAHLCEKTLLHSFRCASRRFEVGSGAGWQERQAEIEVGAMGSASGLWARLSSRPVEFSLSNSSREAVIDVDDVRLLDSDGKNLVVNGDFSRAIDRWFFTVDDLVPWQAANHWVQLYFEQGYWGVLAFTVFLVWVFSRLIGQIAVASWLACIALASFSSFLSIGMFSFLFDTPRMAMLFFFLAVVFAGANGGENSELDANAPAP